MKKDNYAVQLDSTVEAIQQIAYERGVREGRRTLFTHLERRALRSAGHEALAGMFQGNTAALESALNKLDAIGRKPADRHSA